MICKRGTRYDVIVPSILLHTFSYVIIFFNNPDISVKFVHLFPKMMIHFHIIYIYIQNTYSLSK